MKTMNIIFSICAVLCSTFFFAQTIVTGKVTDTDGNPIPGVAVLVADTNQGTTTDFDGAFTINTNTDAILEISSIGFISQSIAVNNQTSISIVMIESLDELEEVIVTGYGVQTRASISGSVGTVSVGDAVKVPVVNAAEALQGRVAGISVVTNGQPGSAPTVRVRGYGTPNNNNPLYIIDGVQTTDAFVLNSLNPNDIDQINVLKDGAAAIYGSRASNGVVIITTKKGERGQKPTIHLEASYGISQATNLPELLNAQQHGQMIWSSKANDGAELTHPQYGTGDSPVIPSSLIGVDLPTTVLPNGTDWLGAIFQTAPTENINLSIQNGTDNGGYLFSLQYLNRDGIQIETGYERAGIRSNGEYKINDFITVGEHLNLTFDKERNGNQVQAALRSSPLIPLRDHNGDFAGIYRTPLGLGNVNSPYATLVRAKDDYNRSLRALGDVYATIKFIPSLPELKFKSSLGGQIRYFNRRSYSPATPEAETGGSRTLTEQDFYQYEWVWTNTLNFRKTFNDVHTIDALVGYEANKIYFKGLQASRSNFLFESPDYYLLDNGEGTPIIDVGSTRESASTLTSVFASFNYSFDNKYFFTGTVRSDRTSRFAPENQTEIFPSASFAWAIDKESFLTENDVLNSLKLRLSYGELGNQQLPADNPNINISGLNESLSFYSFDGTRGSAQSGALLESVGNPDLTWETSVSTNVGLDFGFLDNRLNGSVDWFNITTDGLIVRDNSLVGTTAIDANPPFVNFGDIKNTGFDFSIGYRNESKNQFTYDVAFNVSTYKNEVTSLVNDTPTTGDSGFRGGAVTRSEVGQPLSSYYGRLVDGIFQSQAEVDAHATQEGAAPGRLRYVDVNEDGVINDSDRTIIGSPHPDFIYGINLNFGYSHFDLSMFFNGSQGNDIYNYSKIYSDFPTFVNGNRSIRVLDGWTSSNGSNTQPALSETITNSETQPNSFFVEDGSFVRLKNLQFGYTVPKSKLNTIGLDHLRFYFSATNLFVLTGYDGLDPEVAERNAVTIGVDEGTYPAPRIMSLGFAVNF